MGGGTRGETHRRGLGGGRGWRSLVGLAGEVDWFGGGSGVGSRVVVKRGRGGNESRLSGWVEPLARRIGGRGRSGVRGVVVGALRRTGWGVEAGGGVGEGGGRRRVACGELRRRSPVVGWEEVGLKPLREGVALCGDETQCDPFFEKVPSTSSPLRLHFSRPSQRSKNADTRRMRTKGRRQGREDEEARAVSAGQ